MKKIVSLIILSVMIMMISVNVFAEDIFGEGNNSTTTITGNEYEEAQKNTQDTDKKNETTLPQTGTESFGLGIVLMVCAGSAIFAYKKVSDYRGI